MTDYYEVIYNTCYGGYSFSDEFAEELFRRYPPHTEVGAKLFKPVSHYERFCLFGEEPKEEWKGSYQQIEEKRELVPGTEDYYYLFTTSYHNGKTFSFGKQSKKSGYITRDYKTFYFLSTHEHQWRDKPEVIALGRELDLFGKKGTGRMKCTELAVAKVPVGYGYSIKEYDGMESVSIKPYINEVLTELLAYIDTRDEASLGVMSKKLVKKESTVYDFLYPKVSYDDD